MLTSQASLNNDRREISNIALFSIGMLISLIGTSAYTFAIGLYVLKITGSGITFAANLALGIIPMVVINPFAGVLADRLDRKTIVVTMNLLNGFLLIGIYFFSLSNGISISIIYCSTFIMTVFTTIFNISLESGIPNMVSEKRLMGINSSSKIIDSASAILGPMLGGLIYAFVDINIFIILNGISFIFSAVLEMFIDFKVNVDENDKENKNVNIINDIKEGLNYLIGKKQIINLFTVLIFINLIISFSVSVPLPFIINNVLKLGSKYFGVIQSAFPGGMILGAVIINKVNKRISFKRLINTTSLMLSVCIVLIGIPVIINTGSKTTLIIYTINAFTMGTSISMIDIQLAFILQKVISDEYRGRVLSLGISIAKIMSPIALILSGILINNIPSYILPITGGLLLTVFNSLILKYMSM